MSNLRRSQRLNGKKVKFIEEDDNEEISFSLENSEEIFIDEEVGNKKLSYNPVVTIEKTKRKRDNKDDINKEDEIEERDGYPDSVWLLAGRIENKIRSNPNFSKEDILEAVNECSTNPFVDKKSLKKDNDLYNFIVPDHVIDGVSYNRNTDYNTNIPKEAIELLREIEEEGLTYEKIMETPIPRKYKKKALRLYEILSTYSPDTREYMNLEEDIIQLIEENKGTNHSDMEKLLDLEEQIRKECINPEDNIKKSILELDADNHIKATLLGMHDELQKLAPSDSNYSILRQKLDWGVNLPYKKMMIPKIRLKSSTNTILNSSQIKGYCNAIRAELDRQLYGLNDVKERIMEVVNNRYYNPKTKSIIAFVSPPGRGKNAIVKALSDAVGVKSVSIPLGGMEDPSAIRGDRAVWVGSGPSIFLQILRKLGYSNGHALLDEVDKLKGPKGRSVQDALLHILDYSQNNEFHDQFLSEFTHDISGIWFFLALNSTESLNPAFLDRLDLVYIRDYTIEETIEIIKRHFLPEAIKNVGLLYNNEHVISITDDACIFIAETLSDEMKEFGLRPVQRLVHEVASKLNMLRTNNSKSPGETSNISKNNLSYNLKDFHYPLMYYITPETLRSLIFNNYHQSNME